MKKHIPDRSIRWVSAAIFVLFGLTGIYKVLSPRMSLTYAWIIILLIGICTIAVAYRITKLKR
jgi:hypothetical protein